VPGPRLTVAVLIASQESDTTSLRNAFVMLQATAPQRAVDYFLTIYDQVPQLDEMMQLAVIELIRKESKSAAGEGALKARYIKCIFELLNSGSHSVKYEAATTLTTLTQNPAAVKGKPTSPRGSSGGMGANWGFHSTTQPPLRA